MLTRPGRPSGQERIHWAEGAPNEANILDDIYIYIYIYIKFQIEHWDPKSNVVDHGNTFPDAHSKIPLDGHICKKDFG